MQFAQLSTLKQRVKVGVALPFNVRDADRTLLLARGQLVGTREQLEALFARGALVDMEELRQVAGTEPATPAPPGPAAEQLPALWRERLDGMSRALRARPDRRYAATLHHLTEPVLALIAQDPDLAIFQVLRQDDNEYTQYGTQRAMQAAITAHLMARRLGWDSTRCQTAFKAALTMNVSMFELQGQLAQQSAPLTAKQREAVHSHPQRSVDMLQLGGVSDPDWLDAVAQHHEEPGGQGYPAGLDRVGEMATLLHRADLYTAKLSGRAHREAMAADQAGRQMFSQAPGHPMSVALAKEFGVYPPGCHVALACGETAVVIKRGATVTTPIVASFTSERGAALSEPRRRDTASREYAIMAVVPHKRVKVHVPPEKLMRLALE